MIPAVEQCPAPDLVVVAREVAGDAHLAMAVTKTAARHGAPLIVQDGGLGYHPRTTIGRDYFRDLNEECVDRNIEWWCTGGTSDDQQALDMRQHGTLTGSKVWLASNVLWLPRDFEWLWHGHEWIVETVDLLCRELPAEVLCGALDARTMEWLGG